jgi:hypothetical protein
MKCQDTIADFWSALVDAQGEKIVGSVFSGSGEGRKA